MLNLTSEIYSLFFKIMEFSHYDSCSIAGRAVWTSFPNTTMSTTDSKPLSNRDLR
jgi:hypothetical protein